MVKTIVNKEFKRVLLLVKLFILICFYYEWITNIGNHVGLFFGVDDNSFLGIIAIMFWSIICVLSGLFLGFEALKGLFEPDSLTKKVNLNNGSIEEYLNSTFNNRIGKLMLGLFVVFFFLFSSSSKYYNNYYGLTLRYDAEEFVDMREYYEYVESEYSTDVAESLSLNNNDLFSNKAKKSRDLKLTEHLFTKQEFIFEETGVFQGYSSYSLEEGFFPYLKCLFFSFLETTYRAILFFLIIGTPLLLLVSKCSDEQLGKLIQYGGTILFATLLLWFIYYLGKELFEWIKSFFN